MKSFVLLGYLRKSVFNFDETSSDRYSPARQRAAIERACPKDCTLEFYEDMDISGRFEADRPGWQALLARLAQPDVAGVIVESYDRAFRNLREFLSFYDTVLAPRGLRLISATQNIDISTTDGRAMASVLMAFAELESRKSGDRMSATIRFKQEKEGRHWGRIPFGCDHDPVTHHLVPSTLTYQINGETRFYFDGLREMYTLYATGQYSALQLARALNAAGWRQWDINRTFPQEWTLESVRGVLRRWLLYAGSLPGRGQRPTLDGGHAPILPIELCEQVGDRMRLRAKARGVRQENRIYILSGVLRCATCGEVMSGQCYRTAYGKTHFYYRHRYHKHQCPEPMVHAEPLETGVIEIIKGCEVLLEQVRVGIYQAAEEASRRPDSLAAQLAAKQEGMERLVDLAVSGLITKAQYEARRAPLKIEIERLEAAAGAAAPASIQQAVIQLSQIAETIQLIDKEDSFLLKELVVSLFERLETKGGQITGVTPHAWAAPLFVYGLDLASLIPIYTKYP